MTIMEPAKPDELTPLEWDVHFVDERRKDERRYTLDMDDGPEEHLISQCGHLGEAGQRFRPSGLMAGSHKSAEPVIRGYWSREPWCGV